MKSIKIVVAAAAFCCAASIFAHSGATGIVKQRMEAMGDMSDRAKALAKMFKGEVTFDPTTVRDAANSFVGHAKQMIDWFPDTENSRYGHKSQTKQVVWERWDDFVAEVGDFLHASEAMQEKANQSDDKAELKSAFFAAAKGCKRCHKVFRKPKAK